MATTVKISVSGNGKSALRTSIAAALTTFGYRRHTAVEFFSHDGIQPETASRLMTKLYDLEKATGDAVLTTLSIQSATLVRVEMKRDKNRSV